MFTFAGVRPDSLGVLPTASVQKRFSFDPLHPIPFKFGTSSFVSKPNRNKFDLKASLRKPLTYQAYTGPLKKYKDPRKVSVKARTAGRKLADKRAKRVERRKTARKSRANARNEILMKKRELQ